MRGRAKQNGLIASQSFCATATPHRMLSPDATDPGLAAAVPRLHHDGVAAGREPPEGGAALAGR